MLIADAAQEAGEEESRILARMPPGLPLARVTNKIDLAGLGAGRDAHGTEVRLRLSAKTGEGVAALRAWLLEVAGWRSSSEGVFLARERHLVALRKAASGLDAAQHLQAFELFAEELRLAQQSLGTITGEVTADELLGQIFSRFCIGK
jgi:tRNA modification GTPase